MKRGKKYQDAVKAFDKKEQYDVCLLYTSNGFCVNIDGIYWEKVKVAVNGSLLSRIFSNVTNNICKYAEIGRAHV